MKNPKKNFLSYRLLFFTLIPLTFAFTKFTPVSKSLNFKPVPTPAKNATKIPVPVESKINNQLYIYDSLQLDDLGLSKQAFIDGLKGYYYLLSEGKLNNDNILSIADFSLPSTQKRLFIIDLENHKLLFNTYVAHGRNSGKEYAHHFSNKLRSNMSSPGFYVTLNTYYGDNGLSLRLEGEEKGINDNALKRAIVIHPADYVSESTVKNLGYLGRSLGCPAIPEKVAKPIIQTIKEGSCFFVYCSNQKYITHSPLLNADS
jgi:hypothetical protein